MKKIKQFAKDILRIISTPKFVTLFALVLCMIGLYRHNLNITISGVVALIMANRLVDEYDVELLHLRLKALNSTVEKLTTTIGLKDSVPKTNGRNNVVSVWRILEQIKDQNGETLKSIAEKMPDKERIHFITDIQQKIEHLL